MNPTHRIVIVGGGAGGLELATRLGRQLGARRRAEVVLVDASPTHIWKPLLHEVATGALNTGEDEVNYFSHAFRNGYRFELGRMDGLDRQRRVLTLAAVDDQRGRPLLPPREIPYDTLVLAAGAVANDFGTPGAAQHCQFLNTPADAERLRRTLLEQSFAAAASPDPARKLTIAIVGAGPTGVELAAEIDHTIRAMHHYGADLSPAQLEITLIEGAPTILPGAPAALVGYASAELAERGIQLACNSRVAAVDTQGFRLADGRHLHADIRVWAAGVKGADWLRTLGLATNRQGQIAVDAGLRTVSDERIYAIGDCAATPGADGRTLPATAQVAHQQARWLAGALQRQLRGREPGSFTFHPKGIMVSLGKHTAVGSLAAVVGPRRHYHVEGRGAKLLYVSIYRLHQAVVHGWPLACLLWMGDKLRGVARPALKLH